MPIIPRKIDKHPSTKQKGSDREKCLICSQVMDLFVLDTSKDPPRLIRPVITVMINPTTGEVIAVQSGPRPIDPI
jgi:hypothetical protein